MRDGVRKTRMAGGLAVLAALSLAFVAGCGQSSPGSGGSESGSGGGGETTAGSAGGTTGGTTGETTAANVGSTPPLEQAADRYEDYVVEETALLVALTEPFTQAVIEGDVERAKELYAPAREPWERIEPIAAALGDYDPNIDAREGDVPEDEWRGFHRIEKALWVENTTQGQEEYARRLMRDVNDLQGEVEELELKPVDLVTGSVELLNEVSAGKITGEEERYSHTDLYDIQANVEGSEAAFDELKPEVAGEDLTLANDVTGGFDEVYEELDQYREGDGWVSYEELDEADRRALSQKVDALAEPLSRVGQVLERG